MLWREVTVFDLALRRLYWVLWWCGSAGVEENLRGSFSNPCDGPGWGQMRTWRAELRPDKEGWFQWGDICVDHWKMHQTRKKRRAMTLKAWRTSGCISSQRWSQVWKKLPFQEEKQDIEKWGSKRRIWREGVRKRRRRDDLRPRHKMDHLNGKMRERLSEHSSLRWPHLEV